MTTWIKHELLQIVAGEDLSAEGAKYKAVNLDGTISQAASYRKFGGILEYGAVASSFLSAAYVGITKAFVGGAVGTVGFPLMVANSGFLIAATSGSPTVGRLTDATASSGDIARVFIDAKNLGWFGG